MSPNQQHANRDRHQHKSRCGQHRRVLTHIETAQRTAHGARRSSGPHTGTERLPIAALQAGEHAAGTALRSGGQTVEIEAIVEGRFAVDGGQGTQGQGLQFLGLEARQVNDVNDRPLRRGGLQTLAEIAVRVAGHHDPQIAPLMFAVGKREQHGARAVFEVLTVVQREDAELTTELDLRQTRAQILDTRIKVG